MACSVVEIYLCFRDVIVSIFRVNAEECNTIFRNGGKFLPNLTALPTREQHSYSLPVETKSHVACLVFRKLERCH
jgi:hypothetical protein